MYKAYVFRIYPNKEQEVLINKTIGSARFIYNKMLDEKKIYFQITGDNWRSTPAHYKKHYKWLKEVDSLALCNAQLHLEQAFKNFWQNPKHFGFPEHKKKRSSRQSYTTNLINGNIILLEDGHHLKLPKLGFVNIVQHRPIPDDYKLKSVTISKTSTDKYFASILYEYDETIPELTEIDQDKVIGLDYSMGELYVSSEGDVSEKPKFMRNTEKRLAKEQRKLSRCKKGGKNRRKQRKKVAKLHEKRRNQTKDFLHKKSARMAKECDAVVIEDLNMHGLSQALNFGKSVAENAFGSFRTMLYYKLRKYGKKLVIIDKWYPSSKTCSHCGTVKDKLYLSERVFICNNCGHTMNRDENAAINIKNEGCRILGCSNRGTRGDSPDADLACLRRIEREAPASDA
jgi:putative transposase